MTSSINDVKQSIQQKLLNQKLYSEKNSGRKLPNNDTKKLVDQKIQNQMISDKKYTELSQLQMPLSQEEKEIKLFDDNRDDDVIFGDEFGFLMMPLVNDKEFVNQLLTYFSPSQIKDVVVNWNKYFPQLQVLEGQRMSMIKFVEILENIMAENMFKKGLKGEIQTHKETQGLIPNDDDTLSSLQGNIGDPIYDEDYEDKEYHNNTKAELELLYPQVVDNAFKKLENAKIKNLKFVLKGFSVPKSYDMNKEECVAKLRTIIDDLFYHGDFVTIKSNIIYLGLVEVHDGVVDDDNEFQVLYISKEEWLNSRTDLRLQHQYKGYGLKSHHAPVGNYYIDKQKLGHGILSLRYQKNRHLTNLREQSISNGLKKIVNDMVDKKTFDTADYHKLTNMEQDLARKLNEMIGCGVDVHNDDSLDNELKIVLGELDAGNDNAKLKIRARQLIMHAIRTGRIPRNVGMDEMHTYGL